MGTLKFKTNVNCGGCIAAITPHLNQLEGVTSWKVDTSTPSKILTVEASGIEPDKIIETLKGAGYKADLISAD